MKGIWKAVFIMSAVVFLIFGLYTAFTFDHNSDVAIDRVASYGIPAAFLISSVALAYHIYRKW